jgi:ABC-type amino acid transport substrate-binding protein
VPATRATGQGRSKFTPEDLEIAPKPTLKRSLLKKSTHEWTQEQKTAFDQRFHRNGELVGFDIEMAHRFARQLDARIEFVPVTSIPDAEDRINA